MKKLLFITGTRADYGKIKNLINIIKNNKKFKIFIFITGMHLLKEYGFTYKIIKKDNKKNCNIFLFKNQDIGDTQDIIVSKTIEGFSAFINKIKPDMTIIHGDRPESLGAVISSSLQNILTAHIEGGEFSGNIDEHMRHAISKLSHIHFVSNNVAKKILIRMGELPRSIFTVGSPDIDIMKSNVLPGIDEVKTRYQINFSDYAIVILHPVTTNIKNIESEAKLVLDTLVDSNMNYIIIYPNNDPGSKIILNIYKNFKKKNKKNFIFFESMRFEYFLTLLKFSRFIIGNSSAGVREAPFYGVPSINLGNRQYNRANLKSIKNLDFNKVQIIKNINIIKDKKYKSNFRFGKGDSAKKILNILNKNNLWKISIQKYFFNN
jgi:UDP-N-acetylglucosamine 2-epimerase (hydrolysing)